MKKLFLIPALLLTGCATDPATFKLALDAQRDVKPTIEMSCPLGGCSMSYTDPRDRQGVKLPSNGWDAFNNSVNVAGSVLTGAIVPLAMGAVAVKGFDSLKGSGATSTTTTDASNRSVTDNHSATATPTVVTQPAPTVLTQPAPVVLTQPPPIVVTTPAPVVVTQPAPVVVTPPPTPAAKICTTNPVTGMMVCT